MARLNQAMNAGLAYLDTKGLLDQTLVVLGTEFGRKPWSTRLADLQAKRLLDPTLMVLATMSGHRPRIKDNDGWDEHNEARACRPERGSRLVADGETHSDNLEGTDRQSATLDPAMIAPI